MLRTENVAVGLYLVRGTVACRVPQGQGRHGSNEIIKSELSSIGIVILRVFADAQNGRAGVLFSSSGTGAKPINRSKTPEIAMWRLLKRVRRGWSRSPLSASLPGSLTASDVLGSARLGFEATPVVDADHGVSESRSRRRRGRCCGLWKKHEGNGFAPEGICQACRARSIRRSQLVG